MLNLVKKSKSSDSDEASPIMSKISAITPRNIDNIGLVKLNKKDDVVDKTGVKKMDSIGLGSGPSKQSNVSSKPKGFVFNLGGKKKLKKHSSTLKELPDNKAPHIPRL